MGDDPHRFVGVRVECKSCGHQKAPHGRSAPMGFPYCTEDGRCGDYGSDPLVGCLWPGERCDETPWQHCHVGVAELTSVKESNNAR